MPRTPRKPRSFDYNLVVLGGGSAGLVSAYIAAQVKAKVALIEKEKMGGDCLNTGCVPSKALIRSARFIHDARRSKELGIKSVQLDYDFADVMERVQRVITRIAPHDSVERYSSLGVDCINGSARLISPWEVQVGSRTLTTKNVILATGASPLVPPIPGLNETSYLTTDTIWSLRRLPRRFLVLGGGPIGIELAQAFARLGSEVTVVEMQDRILTKEDPDVSDFIRARLEKEGVRILTGWRAERFAAGKLLCSRSAGMEQLIEFDEVLLALGRKARVEGFGLEELGIRTRENGTLDVDPYLRTSVPNIHACGDVTGPYQFTHTASHQAWYASVNALFSPFRKFKVDYGTIPWCTYTDPEVARVGLNETEANEKGIRYRAVTYDVSDLDRAITDEEAHGFVKVLTEPGKDRILGATLVGSHAGDWSSEFVFAMKHGHGLNDILKTIHIYPTFAEANRYVAGQWRRETAPVKLLRWVEKFHRWRR